MPPYAVGEPPIETHALGQATMFTSCPALAIGRGFTFTFTEAVFVQPNSLVTYTVYLVVVDGHAVELATAGSFRPVEGDHAYVFNDGVPSAVGAPPITAHTP